MMDDAQQSPMPDPVTSPLQLWRAFRELPRPVIVLLVGVAVNRMGSLVQIFLVLYLRRIGISPTYAGLALTAYGTGSIAGIFGGGAITDRIGSRATILVATIGSAALVGLIPLIHVYLLLLCLSLGVGAVTPLYRPAALAMIASLTPPTRLVLTSAAYRLGLNVGVTLAPLFGVLLITYSYTLVFLSDAATSLIFAAVAAFALPSTRVEATKDHGSRREQGGSGYRVLLADRRFMVVVAAMLATALAEVQYQSVLPLQIEARGFPTVLYALVLTINGIMVILFELPSTVYVQRLPMRTSIAAGCTLIGLGISLFGLPVGMWIFIAGAVIWTTGEIISAPSVSAYPALISPPGMRGRYIGVLTTSQSLGYAVGPAIGTALFQFTGSGMWIICLALGGVAGLGMRAGITDPYQNDAATGHDAAQPSAG